MNATTGRVEGMLKCLRHETEDFSRVTVGDIVDALGFRSYGPFLLIPGLLENSPLGAIPGVPTLLAATILIFAAQIVFGRDRLWLPGFIRHRSVSQERMDKALGWAVPVGHWLDKWFHPRLPRFSGDVATRLAAVVCIVLALTVPPLELVPFASSIPMAAVAVFGLAIMVDDGALMLIGFVLAAVALVSGFNMASAAM